MRTNARYDPSVPLAFQVEMLLRRRCEEEWKPGGRLPSELDLCREYRVSRSTTRRALAALESDHVVRREKGRGTFVSSDPLAVQVKKLTGSIADFITHGVATHAKVLSARPTLVTKGVGRMLGVADGEVVARVLRVRYVDGRPLAYVDGYLPWDLGSRILKEDLERLSILHILTKKYRLHVPEAEQTVEAVLANPEIAEHLDIRAGSPVLKIERLFFAPKRRAVYYTHSFYRADRYKFSVTLNSRKGAQAGASALVAKER